MSCEKKITFLKKHTHTHTLHFWSLDTVHARRLSNNDSLKFDEQQSTWNHSPRYDKRRAYIYLSFVRSFISMTIASPRKLCCRLASVRKCSDTASAPRNIPNIVINVWIKQIFNMRLSCFTKQTAKRKIRARRMKSLQQRNPDKFHYFLFIFCVDFHAYNLLKFTISPWLKWII